MSEQPQQQESSQVASGPRAKQTSAARDEEAARTATRRQPAARAAFAPRDRQAHVAAVPPGAPAAALASVSVVIPCYNEERFIGQVLANLSGQYPQERYEIVVVDGLSTDKTRAVVLEFAARQSGLPVRLVSNPARDIPTGLNLGIDQAQGEIIVRMDAHSIPTHNYVRRCVELLSDPELAVVGMPWRIQPGAATLTARAIALAVAHPFGIGDAKYRLSDLAGAHFVDTVPFGAFRKTLWQELGGFNETLLTNEDYDFNYRVRRAGGRILLDNAEHCNYFARATIKELARQYLRYGHWKAQMVKLHPRSIKLRHIVAPAFVSGVALLSVLGLWWPRAGWGLLAVLMSYVALALACGAQLARRGGTPALLLPTAFVFLVLHVAWGSSFLLGLIRTPRRR